MRRGKFSEGHTDRTKGPGHGHVNRSDGRNRNLQRDGDVPKADPAARWRSYERLVARACVLGICGGDWERVIDLTPERLFAVLDEAKKQRAEDRLATLAAVNRGFAGGDGYKKLARSLGRQAGIKES